MSKNLSEDISENVYLRIIPRLRRSHKRVDGEFDDEEGKIETQLFLAPNRYSIPTLQAVQARVPVTNKYE